MRRRRFLAFLLFLALSTAGLVETPLVRADEAPSATVCPQPRVMDGFKSCADLDAAESEAQLVVYSADPEHGTVKLLAAFHAAFPKITTAYVRLQGGAIYAKLTAERQARSYLVDILQQSDVGLMLDFERRGGYAQYVSPEMAAYRPEYKSHPEGYYTWGAVIMAGLAYNPQLVSAAEAPRGWQDALSPRWAGRTNVKVTNAGLQHAIWYALRQVEGPEYWSRFEALKPRAFDSYVQQYDRLVSQQDAIIHGAQFSGYLEYKAKGAPVAFVHPDAGMPATPESWGVVKEAPHPQAARLFMDWLLSPAGQKVYSDALFLNSVRDGAPPPPGGIPISELKLLLPADWNDLLASRREYTREWDRLTGAR